MCRGFSTESPDRLNEVVLARGMNDSQFQTNPLVTLGHAYHLPPVGRSLWRKRVQGRQPGRHQGQDGLSVPAGVLARGRRLAARQGTGPDRGPVGRASRLLSAAQGYTVPGSVTANKTAGIRWSWSSTTGCYWNMPVCFCRPTRTPWSRASPRDWWMCRDIPHRPGSRSRPVAPTPREGEAPAEPVRLIPLRLWKRSSGMWSDLWRG